MSQWFREIGEKLGITEKRYSLSCFLILDFLLFIYAHHCFRWSQFFLKTSFFWRTYVLLEWVFFVASYYAWNIHFEVH